MNSSLLTNEVPRSSFRWSSAVRLAMAAGAAVALTMTGVTLMKSGNTPSLKGNQLYSSGEPNLGESENVLAVRFEKFMNQYSKVYGSTEEQALRFEIFKSNSRFIKEQNTQGLLTWTVVLSPMEKHLSL